MTALDLPGFGRSSKPPTGYDSPEGIRDLGGITLHRLGTCNDLTSVFPNAGRLLTGTVDVGLIRSQWDEVVRLAASLKYGHATASLVVGRLHASSRRSALALRPFASR